jgi:hypothetical protein
MNVIDELGEAGAKPTYLRGSGVKMRDVAVAAGVSVATVSNVINHPHMVAPGTRERVRCIVRELDFQPDPHAKALHGPGTGVSEPKPETVPGSVPTSQEDHLETPHHIVTDAPLASERSGRTPEVLEPGTYLSFRVGPEFLSGTVDTVMPDGSCFWIWTDGGMGRRMIEASDAVAVETGTSE